MRTILLAMPALAGLLAGWYGGVRISSAGHGLVASAPAANSGRRDRTEAASQRSNETARGDGHDLKSLRRWHLQQKSGGLETISQLERMDTAAIRDLMTGLVAAQKDDRATDFGEILAAAAGELFRREGEEALEWANRLDPSAGRTLLIDQMIRAAAGQSPEIALPWIGRYHQEFGKGLSNEFGRAAIIGATARGAEDLLRLKELYGDELRGCQFPIGPYPDGFDFHLLVAKLPFSSDLRPTLACWTARDRDAAWAGIKEVIERDRNLAAGYFGSLFTGIAATEGDRKAARWVAAKLDEVPPDLRERAIASILTDQLLENASYESVMAGLPRESDRVALAGSLVSPGGNSPAALGALKLLGSEALQTDALASAAVGFSRMVADTGNPNSRMVLDYFDGLMNQLKLSPASREKITTTLHTPRDPYPQ